MRVLRSKITKRIIAETSNGLRRDVKDYANKLVGLDYGKKIIPVEHFETNPDFAKMVISEYEDAKEKNCSWYGPKIPFYISHPKLIDNAKTAMSVLKNKKTE